MQLPTWIPQVPRPWNPAWREVYDCMSPNERRWSFVVDVCIVGVVLLAMAWLK